MDKTFTLGQLYSLLLAILAFITACGGAWAVLSKIVNKAKAPNEAQNKRLDDLSTRVSSVEAALNVQNSVISTDTQQIKELEKSNRVTQEALLALLSHAINGNNVEILQTAQKHLHAHLFNTESN